MSRTVVATDFGGPEVLTVQSIEVADPGPGEVRVALRAIAVNPYDIKSYSGRFGTDRTRLPIALGSEAAGEVVAVGPDSDPAETGPNITRPIAVGDAVIMIGNGLYADEVIVRTDDVVRKPDDLSWEESAGLLLTGTTAVDTLETVGVRAGSTVVVQGAAGAVGHHVVQAAVARGASVIGLAREHQLDAVRASGALAVAYGDHVMGRVRAAAPAGVDAVIDTVGTDDIVDLSLAIAPDPGNLVSIVAFGRAGTDGFHAVGGGDNESGRRRRAAREWVVQAAAAGTLTVNVAAVYPLAEAARAHGDMVARAGVGPAGQHGGGKFVLVP